MHIMNKASIEIGKLLDAFKKGNIPKTIAKVVLVCPDMPSSKWTLANRLLAFFQTFDIDCRGFRQWNEIERNVKRGSKAAYIFKPVVVKQPDDETGDEKEILVNFQSIPVFPYSSTEGKALKGLMPKEPPALIDVAKKLGVEVDYSSFGGMFLGAYSKKKKRITLCTHDEQTFFHELAHAAHNKILGDELKPGQDAKQEIIAELSACVLARIYGKRHANEGATYEYIEAYAHHSDEKVYDAIIPLLSDIEHVLSCIISLAENGDTTTQHNKYADISAARVAGGDSSSSVKPCEVRV